MEFKLKYVISKCKLFFNNKGLTQDLMNAMYLLVS